MGHIGVVNMLVGEVSASLASEVLAGGGHGSPQGLSGDSGHS